MVMTLLEFSGIILLRRSSIRRSDLHLNREESDPICNVLDTWRTRDFGGLSFIRLGNFSDAYEPVFNSAMNLIEKHNAFCNCRLQLLLFYKEKYVSERMLQASNSGFQEYCDSLLPSSINGEERRCLALVIVNIFKQRSGDLWRKYYAEIYLFIEDFQHITYIISLQL